MMSHASAISRPPPSAKPFTAAMTGFQRSKRAVMPPKPVAGMRGMPCSAVHLRSLPAENAFSPAPVRIATQASGSAAKSSHALRQLLVGSRMQRVHHLGRLMVTRGDVVALLVADELEAHATLIAQPATV